MERITIKTSIATNRFGMGAKPNELIEASQGEQEWLIQKLISPTFNSSLLTSSQGLAFAAEFRTMRKESEKALKAMMNKEGESPKKIKKDMRPYAYLAELSADTIQQSIRSDASISWRFLDFFSNHFSVSASGILMSVLAPTLEREAIAPHLYGRFEDMLIAVITHPAMLVYLNNEQSFGPSSKIAKKRKGKGLNENLAREILELHTLGVNGGYQQSDVIELAKSITGWSIARQGKTEEIKNGGFYFREKGHEPGSRTILGNKYKEDGVAQGKNILRDLARHPSTAHFISTKIARHFTADKPSPKLIEALKKTWLKTDGNLKEVYITLIQSKYAWQGNTTKYKSPRDFIISACRATGQSKWKDKQLISALQNLGQKPFSAGSPAGFADVSSAWDGADALYARVEWSAQFAKRFRKKSAIELASLSLGSALSKETNTHLLRAESQEQAIALLLMSPEFQRR